MMKINDKILSIPPYISTSWKAIASLHMEQRHNTFLLVATLHSGAQIEIPGLQKPVLDMIFQCHNQYLEKEEGALRLETMKFPLNLDTLFSFGIGNKEELQEMQQFGSVLQHNPEQTEGPDLPEALLTKITELAKTLHIDNEEQLPCAEPHCNCMHCQVANALRKGCESEEIVTDEELRFRSWEISQTGEKLYLVQNPIDAQEHYNVYLGDPLGCTCGQKHCEHLEAVLKS